MRNGQKLKKSLLSRQKAPGMHGQSLTITEENLGTWEPSLLRNRGNHQRSPSDGKGEPMEKMVVDWLS